MRDEPTIPDGFCQCGCGQATQLVTQTSARRGIKAGDFRKYVQGHNGALSRERYINDPATGCWVWQRSVNPQTGYGMLTHRRKVQSAHRWFYVQAKGLIPEGLHLDHLCMNKRCVNPDHLEPVTLAENSRRWRESLRRIV